MQPVPHLFLDRSSMWAYTHNRYGDRIPPCVTPLFTRKGSHTAPPPPHHHHRTTILCIVYQHIKIMIRYPGVQRFISFKKKLWLILSNALDASMKHNKKWSSVCGTQVQFLLRHKYIRWRTSTNMSRRVKFCHEQ